jgi:ribosomal protein L7Ae-like RNA K-turn-binding protein
MDCESIEAVVAPPFHQQPVLRTPLASQVTKEIFLERFRKEILDRFNFSLCSQIRIEGKETLADIKQRRNILKQRIPIGINAVTRALEAACYGKRPAPSLVVLTSDLHPPTLQAHIPVLAAQLRTPVFLLPGDASSEELGKLLGTKRVAALAFLPHAAVYQMTSQEEQVHGAVDSFVAFVRGKLEP